MRCTPKIFVLSAVVAASAVASPSRAADPTTADCLGASESAISLRNAHKLRAARAQLLVCAAPNCPSDVRNECIRRVTEVNASIPTIVFEVKDATGADLSAVKVSMDGEPLAERLEGTPLSIDPGAHTFAFEAAGQANIEKTFIIRQGEKDRREKVILSAAAPTALTAPEPPSASAPAQPETASLSTDQASKLPAQKIGAIVAASVGVVGLGIGTVFGLQSMSKHKEASNACPDRCTDQNGVDLWNSARSAGNAATVGFIVGGVGLAAGAVLWFTAKPSASTQIGFGPGSVELKGSW
jgi:hypothetical protein